MLLEKTEMSAKELQIMRSQKKVLLRNGQNVFRGCCNHSNGIAVASSLFPARHDNNWIVCLEEVHFECGLDSGLYPLVSIRHPVGCFICKLEQFDSKVHTSTAMNLPGTTTGITPRHSLSTLATASSPSTATIGAKGRYLERNRAALWVRAVINFEASTCHSIVTHCPVVERTIIAEAFVWIEISTAEIAVAWVGEVGWGTKSFRSL